MENPTTTAEAAEKAKVAQAKIIRRRNNERIPALFAVGIVGIIVLFKYPLSVISPSSLSSPPPLDLEKSTLPANTESSPVTAMKTEDYELKNIQKIWNTRSAMCSRSMPRKPC